VSPAALRVLQEECQKLPIDSKFKAQAKLEFIGEAACELQPKAELLQHSLGSPSEVRVEVSGELAKYYKKLADADWRARKDGLDGLEKVLQ